MSENMKSKTILILLESSGLGIFGIDRMYAGQIWWGILKFITLGGLGIWVFIDWLRVVINALMKSKEGLFGITEWYDDVNISFYVMLFILILKLIMIILTSTIYKNYENDYNWYDNINSWFYNNKYDYKNKYYKNKDYENEDYENEEYENDNNNDLHDYNRHEYDYYQRYYGDDDDYNKDVYYKDRYKNSYDNYYGEKYETNYYKR